MLDGRHAIGRRLSRGEVSCRIHCIEQNVAVISRTSVAPSLHFALPQPKYEPNSRMAQHYSSLAEAEELAFGH